MPSPATAKPAEPRPWTAVGPANAPTIVFVHGTRLYRNQWLPQLRRLSGRYRCVAIDLPGHGERADEPFTMSRGERRRHRGRRGRGAAAAARVDRRAVAGRVRRDRGGGGAAPSGSPASCSSGCSAEPVGPVALPFRALAALLERRAARRPGRVEPRLLPDPLRPRGRAIRSSTGGFWSAGGAAGAAGARRTRLLERLARLWTPVLVVNGALDPRVRAAAATRGRAACRRGRHVGARRGRCTWPTSTGRRPSRTSSPRSRPTRPGRPDRRSTSPRPCPRGRQRGLGYTAAAPLPCPRGSMRVRKAVFPAAGWGTRFLPATKAQPKEMLPLVDKPVIQYAVEEAVAAGIEQVIIVTSSPEAGDRGPLRPQLRAGAPARGEGRDREAAPGAAHQRPRPGRLRAPEGAAGPRPRGADGQGPHRPRAVRGHPPGRRRGRRPAVHRPADPRLPAAPRVRRRGDGGPARGDAPLRRHRAATTSTDGADRDRTLPRDRDRREAGARHGARRTSRSSAATC